MPGPETPLTTCAVCHRVVYLTDVNTEGVCVLCAPGAEVLDEPASESPDREDG